MQHANSAKKAISLSKDSTFRLLVLMLAMLGWLCASFAGSIVLLENAYNKWNLQQKSNISVYIDADENSADVVKLVDELNSLNGVTRAYLLVKEEVQSLIQPYFSSESYFPLPFVIDVTVTEKLDREHFNNKVSKFFENATVEDTRGLLTKVSYIVSFLQSVVVIIAITLFIVVSIIVSLTVKAGLQNKQESLRTMQHIGAKDDFLVALVSQQVLWQSLIGFILAAAFSTLTVYLICYKWFNLSDYVNGYVWFACAITPLVLTLASFIAAKSTAKYLIKRVV